MSWKKRLESTLVAAFVVGGMARNRNAPLREKARAMLKLIKQAERLVEKTSQRGGRT